MEYLKEIVCNKLKCKFIVHKPTSLLNNFQLHQKFHVQFNTYTILYQHNFVQPLYPLTTATEIFNTAIHRSKTRQTGNFYLDMRFFYACSAGTPEGSVSATQTKMRQPAAIPTENLHVISRTRISNPSYVIIL